MSPYILLISQIRLSFINNRKLLITGVRKLNKATYNRRNQVKVPVMSR